MRFIISSLWISLFLNKAVGSINQLYLLTNLFYLLVSLSGVTLYSQRTKENRCDKKRNGGVINNPLN